MNRIQQAKEELVHALSRKLLSIPSLCLSCFLVTIPILSTTVLGGANSHYDSCKKPRNHCFPMGLGRLEETFG